MPDASSIGFIPYWRFLNPPVAKPTYVTLRPDSKLILHPDTLICRGVYLGVGAGKHLTLNEGSYIGHEAYIATRCGLEIGKNSLIGYQVLIMDYDGHPIFIPGQPYLKTLMEVHQSRSSSGMTYGLDSEVRF